MAPTQTPGEEGSEAKVQASSHIGGSRARCTPFAARLPVVATTWLRAAAAHLCRTTAAVAEQLFSRMLGVGATWSWLRIQPGGWKVATIPCAASAYISNTPPPPHRHVCHWLLISHNSTTVLTLEASLLAPHQVHVVLSSTFWKNMWYFPL